VTVGGIVAMLRSDRERRALAMPRNWPGRRRTPVLPLSFKLDKLPWPIGLLSAIFIQVGENPRAGVSDAVA
jgi:hypothetical protein